MPDPVERQALPDHCSCRVKGPEFEDTIFDPACPFHGDNGTMVCVVPPKGWHCTRGAGHNGPCAAWPTRDVGPSEVDRLRAENERLRGTLDGLDQYVGHDELCNMQSGAPECSCGFDEMYTKARALVRGMAGSARASDEVDALRSNEPVTSTDEQEASDAV